MSQCSQADTQSTAGVDSADRREWIRIEDDLLLEYRLLGEQAGIEDRVRTQATDAMIAAAVEKPTAELLARSGDIIANAALTPWIQKVDWLLEVILKTLAKSHPGCVDLARVTTVNISGGGIGFTTPQRFSTGDRLAIKLILPPFTPIHAVAEVVRSIPMPSSEEGFVLAAKFVDLTADDQEHLIRYILQAQAERLRSRHAKRASA